MGPKLLEILKRSLVVVFDATYESGICQLQPTSLAFVNL